MSPPLFLSSVVLDAFLSFEPLENTTVLSPFELDFPPQKTVNDPGMGLVKRWGCLSGASVW